MESTLNLLERLINGLPGPGKLILSSLVADRQALRVLIACMAAIFATSLQPPFLSLYSSNVQQGLRDPGSGVPLEVAAGYLLLAVLTLVGGASGDIFGRKRLMQFGLLGVIATNLAGMVLLDSSYYPQVNALNSILSVPVMPMSVAIVTLAFPLQVRPFAHGAVFGMQGVGLIAASSMGSASSNNTRPLPTGGSRAHQRDIPHVD